MIMGNYLGVVAVGMCTMATEHAGGMDHPTVVPENFEPEDEESCGHEIDEED